MIENFNNLLLLVLHLAIIGLLSIFLVRIFFFPQGIVKEYNVDQSGILPMRYVGTFIFGFVFMGIYILFRPNGPEGTWVFYNLFFLVATAQLIYDLMFYFKFIDKDIGAKNSIIDLTFSFAAFIISVILIYGLSNKIYL
jgi:hypothetical protein|tara:strand:- start:201 stop:617 length:417 start_codon:yes stop_codon:yes gene_type:complete